MTGPIQGPEQQTYIQQQVLQDEIKRIQQKKQVEKDILMAESGQTTISETLAPASTYWAAPQLVKAQYTSDQLPQDCLKALKNLPPPPPSIQRFQKDLAQAKNVGSFFASNLNQFVSSTGAPQTLGSGEPVPPQGIANWGESAFLQIAAKIHIKEAGIPQKIFEESLEVGKISLVKLEMIEAVAADVENLMGTLQNDMIALENAEKELNGPPGTGAAGSLQHYESLYKDISNLLRNGDVEYLDHTYNARGIPTNIWKPIYLSGYVDSNGSHIGPVTEFLSNWGNFKAQGPNGNGGFRTEGMAKAGCGKTTLGNMCGAQNITAANKVWDNFSSNYANKKAEVHTLTKEIASYKGEPYNRYIIPPGHTKTWAAKFPNWPICTTLNGGREFLIPTNIGWDTAYMDFLNAGLIGPPSGYTGGPIQPPAPPPNWGHTSWGQIAKMNQLIAEKGAGLCYLLGFPPGQINFADIQLALELAKKLAKIFKKLLEQIHDSGNGLAVFNAFMNAISQAQLRNQQVEAQSEQKTTNFNLQQLDKLQAYNNIIAQDLLNVSNLTDQLDSYQAIVSALSKAAEYSGIALGALGGAAAITSFAMSFFPGLDVVGAIVDTIGLVSGVLGGLASGGLGAYLGTEEYKMGKVQEDLGTAQKQLASDQAHVQETEAASTFISAISSNTTQTLSSLVQTVAAEEKAALGAITNLSAAVTQAAQA